VCCQTKRKRFEQACAFFSFSLPKPETVENFYKPMADPDGLWVFKATLLKFYYIHTNIRYLMLRPAPIFLDSGFCLRTVGLSRYINNIS
jgi:hypothetical protein